MCRVRVIGWLVVTASLSLSACAPDGESPTSTPRFSVGENQSLFQPGEQRFAQIAARAPSFGGFYVDGDNLVVMSTSDDANVRGAITDLAPEIFATTDDRPTRIEIQRVAYPVQALANWRNAAMTVAEQAGIRTLDLDERRNRVTVGVEPGTQQERLFFLLADVGIPSEALHIMEVGSVVSDATLNARTRPLAGGYRHFVFTNPGGAPCTTTAIAKKSGTLSILTASHCTETTSSQYWNTSGEFPAALYQLDVLSPNLMGSEASDPNPFICAFHLCRYSDAARFVLAGSATPDSVAFGRIARPINAVYGWGGSGSLTVSTSSPEFFIDSEDPYPSAGERVHKVGQFTGWTHGRVRDTCVAVFAAPNYLLLCQYTANYGRGPGDSGAPVFKYSFGTDQTATLTGIHSGALPGDTVAFFSPWGGVESDLGALSTFDPPPVASIDGPSEVPPSVSCEWYAHVSGGAAPFTYSWSGVLSGSGSSVSGSLSSSGTLYLSVTDANMLTSNTSLWIAVDEWAECLE